MAEPSKGPVSGHSPERGARIAQAIDLAGGVVQTAKKLGVTRETPSRWRDGRSEISLYNVERLADAANVSPIWLAFGEQGEDATDGSVPVWAVRDAWRWWMPVVLKLTDPPDSEELFIQFLRDSQRRAAERAGPG